MQHTNFKSTSDSQKIVWTQSIQSVLLKANKNIFFRTRSWLQTQTKPDVMVFENVVYSVIEISNQGRTKILDPHGSKEAGRATVLMNTHESSHPRQKRLSEMDQRSPSLAFPSLIFLYPITKQTDINGTLEGKIIYFTLEKWYK